VAGGTVNHRTRVGAERRVRTRLRILESAVRVFAEKGADIPVIDDFIRAAGLSHGTFYNYFRTAADLLEATVAWLADDLIRSIDPEVAKIQEPALRMATAIRMYLRWASMDSEWCAFMAKVPRIGLVAERRSRRDLRQGRETGVFRYTSAAAAHDLIVGASQRAIRHMAQEALPFAQVEETVALILRGLAVPEGRIEEILCSPLPELRLPVKSQSLLHRTRKLSSPSSGPPGLGSSGNPKP
jgi:AcrR family transcriptional regulator